MDSFSNKRSSVANPSFNDAGGNNENELTPEMASKLKSPSKKHLPSKNFMSPTISTAIKTAYPKKKILAERNETLDVVEQTSLLRSSSFGSKAVKFPVVEADDDVEKDFVAKSSSKPYDPIKNYLSPRPKFLRYNPNRRRKIFVLQENEDGVKSSSSSFDAGIPSPGLVSRADSSDSTGSYSKQESVEEAEDIIDKEGEGEGEGEDEDETEEEMVEFGEDKGCGLKGFLKFLVVVIALISTTQAICSMNSPTPSPTLVSVWSFNDWSSVYGAPGLNFSEVGCDPTKEADLVVGRWKEGEVYHDYEGLYMVETIEEMVEVQHEQIEIDDGVYQDEVVSKEDTDLSQELETPDNEVENDETDVIQDEIWGQQEDSDQIEILQEHEIAASDVIEIDNVEAVREVPVQPLRADFNQEGVIEETSQLTTDAGYKVAKAMEDVVEEIADVVITDLIVAVLIGLSVLILASFSVVYRSRRMKPSSPVATTVAKEDNVADKEDIKDPEPSPYPSSLIQQIEEEPLVNSKSLAQKDVSNEISGVHAPTVELLGEFVFGGEADDSNSSFSDTMNKTSMVEATTVSSSQTRFSHTETPTVADTTEKMAKKQRRKNAEVSSMVTPSPVRRSSRIQKRSLMSP